MSKPYYQSPLHQLLARPLTNQLQQIEHSKFNKLIQEEYQKKQKKYFQVWTIIAYVNLYFYEYFVFQLTQKYETTLKDFLIVFILLLILFLNSKNNQYTRKSIFRKMMLITLLFTPIIQSMFQFVHYKVQIIIGLNVFSLILKDKSRRNILQTSELITILKIFLYVSSLENLLIAFIFINAQFGAFILTEPNPQKQTQLCFFCVLVGLFLLIQKYQVVIFYIITITTLLIIRMLESKTNPLKLKYAGHWELPKVNNYK